MLVGCSVFAAWQVVFSHQRNARLSEKVKSGLFIMSRLCSQKMFSKTFFLFQDGKKKKKGKTF